MTTTHLIDARRRSRVARRAASAIVLVGVAALLAVTTSPVLAKASPWPPDTEQFLRGLAPALEYHEWDGVGHFLMMERPAAFNDLLAAFLNRNAPVKP